jgi:hypothetical protein
MFSCYTTFKLSVAFVYGQCDDVTGWDGCRRTNGPALALALGTVQCPVYLWLIRRDNEGDSDGNDSESQGTVPYPDEHLSGPLLKSSNSRGGSPTTRLGQESYPSRKDERAQVSLTIADEAYRSISSRKHVLTLQLHTAHILAASASLDEKGRTLQDVQEQRNRSDPSFHTNFRITNLLH